ncbi:hypothetical protein M758_12G098600 [Ceratodon purpureus]|nr:hypothetical protein M758_12G098600 [Ceratodon purpureus]
MAASGSDSEFLTALGREHEQATTSAPVFVTALEEQIELSRRHWSELADSSECISKEEEEAAIKLDNEEVFMTLEMHPEWGEFLWGLHVFASLELGEKFAEGAQAELFHAHVQWRNPKSNERDQEDGIEWVVKVFKKGSLVRHLQQQWPHGLLQIKLKNLKRFKIGKTLENRHYCDVFCATLLEDGRFAFLMVREDEDLRTLIDCKMSESHCMSGPFSKEVAEEIMHRVAMGMNQLHSYGIVHRDLKASNVLVKTSSHGKYTYCSVADFECSIGVVGTRFWRAPEILQACKEGNANMRLELFSKSSDSYSFGMTCYEILTGRIPFQDHPLIEQRLLLTDLVINYHLRSDVPEYVNDWACELLRWCWRSDPIARPSFEDILSFIEANSESEYVKEEAAERMRGDDAEWILASEDNSKPA